MIVPYIGPLFDYRSNGSGAWHWTLQHALLYSAPGAAAFIFGLIVLFAARGGQAVVRASLGLSGLVLIASGAWFVIGPAVWPMLHSGVVFGGATSNTARFVNMVGYNLGVGVLLSALGGMVMKASIGEREISRSTGASTGTVPVRERVNEPVEQRPMSAGEVAPGEGRVVDA